MIDPITEANAVEMEEKFGFPKDVYISLSQKFGASSLHTYLMSMEAPLQARVDTGFALGMLIGYLHALGRDSEIDAFFDPTFKKTKMPDTINKDGQP